MGATSTAPAPRPQAAGGTIPLSGDHGRHYRGLELLQHLWRFLAPQRKVQIILLGVLMLGGSLLEMVSLGAVLPFVGALMNPETMLQQVKFARIAALLGINSAQELILPMTTAFIGIVILTGFSRLTLLWGTQRMSYVVGADISTEVYRRTLYQPYCIHASRNSSQLISSITKKVSHAMHVFQALLTAITSLATSIGITAALLFIDPLMASTAAAVFATSYLAVAKFTRRRLLRNGKHIKESAALLVKSLQEGLGGIRDVLLDGTQEVHSAAYRKVDRPLRRAIASNHFVAASPRVVMEALSIASVAGLAFFLSQREGGIGNALPVLGVLALGAQRLLPAFQHVYAGYANFVGHQTSIAEIVNLLEQPLPNHAFEPPPPPLQFEREVLLKNISFRYPGTEALVLQELNLVLKKGSRIGFVGKTGGGKSTTLDLLMGLLEPTSGEILVDGKAVTGTHRRAWQRALAHVPQSIFLADSTMAENIAFGVPPNKIDLERVKQAARVARIADYIESQPKGYNSTVGERGVRLSGGQRQRIGIARALYKQASVLIFDEATSALDNTTERELIDAIESL
ncbi:MAG TPA: ABC transporter ATP-binding protein, partial [Polyangiaceae bacterium]|nr:ABC transporter ATP-binding protein [Polyangiaceae bacterium]